MRPFAYERAATATLAVRAGAGDGRGGRTESARGRAQFLAGGTTLVDLMKLGVMQPEKIIDINDLATRHSGVEVRRDGLRLGALATMAAVADHPAVRSGYPLVAQSLALAASSQIRNMATLGGNVMQRTRCSYFRDAYWKTCNKRYPGSGCGAMAGVNRRHAVLGVSDACIATYPGDFAQALVALDATVEIASRERPRTIRFEQLHRLPGTTPQFETTLAPGDLILSFFIPAGAWHRRSLYLKIRDRESYEFALASAAVALDLRDGAVQEARIGLGGVATKPWRAQAAEAALKGKPLSEATAWAAAELAFSDAVTHGQNDYKPELGRRTLVRTLLEAGAMKV